MAITDHFLISNGNKTDIGWFENNLDAMWKWLDAAILIRYRIVNLTGDRRQDTGDKRPESSSSLLVLRLASWIKRSSIAMVERPFS